MTGPESWGSLKAALSFMERYGVPGIGFVFTAEVPIVGIDLDECVAIGEPTLQSPWAEMLVADIDSYTELSPSGTGLHILSVGSAGGLFEYCPPGMGQTSVSRGLDPKGGARPLGFLTITGQRLNGCPLEIRERTRPLRRLMDLHGVDASIPFGLPVEDKSDGFRWLGQRKPIFADEGSHPLIGEFEGILIPNDDGRLLIDRGETWVEVESKTGNYKEHGAAQRFLPDSSGEYVYIPESFNEYYSFGSQIPLYLSWKPGPRPPLPHLIPVYEFEIKTEKVELFTSQRNRLDVPSVRGLASSLRFEQIWIRDVVYAIAPNYELTAVSMSTGEELWRLQDFGMFGSLQPAPAICVTQDALVLFNGAELLAVNRTDGSVVWERALDLYALDSTGFHARHRFVADGMYAYTWLSNNSLVSIDLRSGTDVWRLDLGVEDEHRRLPRAVALWNMEKILIAQSTHMLYGFEKP